MPDFCNLCQQLFWTMHDPRCWVIDSWQRVIIKTFTLAAGALEGNRCHIISYLIISCHVIYDQIWSFVSYLIILIHNNSLYILYDRSMTIRSNGSMEDMGRKNWYWHPYLPSAAIFAPWCCCLGLTTSRFILLFLQMAKATICFATWNTEILYKIGPSFSNLNGQS